MSERARRLWSRRVSRWRRSGKTSKEFAAEIGVSPATLLWWSSALRRERTWRRPVARRRVRVDEKLAKLPLVEFRGSMGSDDRFELELGSGRRLRIPATFDAETLARLLAVLA